MIKEKDVTEVFMFIIWDDWNSRVLSEITLYSKSKLLIQTMSLCPFETNLMENRSKIPIVLIYDPIQWFVYKEMYNETDKMGVGFCQIRSYKMIIRIPWLWQLGMTDPY